MRLNADRILEEWSSLLEGCSGETSRIVDDFQNHLKASNLADMRWSEESLAPSLFTGVLGRRLGCVRVRHRKFREVVVVAGAHDHGAGLIVFWIAAARPRLLGHFRRLIRYGPGSDRRWEIAAEFDIVQTWSLGAFLETTRVAMRRSIQDLVNERKLEGRKRDLLL